MSEEDNKNLGEEKEVKIERGYYSENGLNIVSTSQYDSELLERIEEYEHTPYQEYLFTIADDLYRVNNGGSEEDKNNLYLQLMQGFSNENKEHLTLSKIALMSYLLDAKGEEYLNKLGEREKLILDGLLTNYKVIENTLNNLELKVVNEVFYFGTMEEKDLINLNNLFKGYLFNTVINYYFSLIEEEPFIKSDDKLEGEDLTVLTEYLYMLIGFTNVFSLTIQGYDIELEDKLVKVLKGKYKNSN